MPTLPEHLALGLLHVQVPGADDHVDRRDRLGAVGERRDRLGAAHPVDGRGAGEPARAEDHRVDVSVGARGRAHDDLLDPGDPGRDDAHHDRARVRRAAARDVHRRRSPRAPARAGPRACRARPSRPLAVAARAASATASTLAIARSSPSRTARVQPVGGARRARRRRRAAAWARRRRCRTRACSHDSAASPPPRTRATISATAGADRLRRRARAPAAGRRARAGSPLSADPLTPHRAAPAARRSPAALQLVRDRVGDQPGGAVRDLLPDDEPVLPQRGPGRGEVDDPLDEPGQRRQLDRALDLDDLRLTAGVEEVARRDPRVLGRDPDHPEAPERLGRAVLAGDRRQHHRALAVAEVDELVDLALGLLDQDVLAGDPEIGGAGLDVRGDVRRAHRHDPGLLEQQLAVVVAHLVGVEPEPVEQVERVLEQRAARAPRSAARSPSASRRPRSSPVSAMCSRSTSSANPTAGSGRPNPASSSS